LYTALLADASARWKSLKNRKFFFSSLFDSLFSKNVFFFKDEDVMLATGTDEHGIKIQKRAKQENKKTLEYCNEISGSVQCFLYF
jgi:methionyl-tRNA synthetase